MKILVSLFACDNISCYIETVCWVQKFSCSPMQWNSHIIKPQDNVNIAKKKSIIKKNSLSSIAYNTFLLGVINSKSGWLVGNANTTGYLGLGISTRGGTFTAGNFFVPKFENYIFALCYYILCTLYLHFLLVSEGGKVVTVKLAPWVLSSTPRRFYCHL